MNCQNMNISDLTGIEAFTALTSLLCGNNPLGTIDVSQNTALVTFQPHNNGLSSVDVSQNTALGNFVCASNNLTSLDVSQNANLYLLSCGFNGLTSLDISQNSNLATLSVNNNQLSTVDVSQNTALTTFFCDTNNFSALDVSNNTNISYFSCAANDLASLNMNNLSTTTLANFNATSNPNLTCIEVDDVSAATSVWTNIDVTASFSLSCAVLVTSIDVIGQGGADAITTPGGTLQMVATVLPANADDGSYTWSVTNGTGSASIDANGVLTAITDGTVTVTATANDGSGVTGDAVITLSNQGVGINEAAAAINLRAYPNPVNGQLTIEADETIEAIALIDVTGKTVRAFSGANNRIDVSTLESGVYLLQVQTAKGIATKRLIKN